MILIDAIQLRKRMEMICDRTCPYLESKNKYTMCAACPLGDAFPEVDEAPEVNAIPIEWIEEWGWKNGMSESMSLRVMIDDWEKENDKTH